MFGPSAQPPKTMNSERTIILTVAQMLRDQGLQGQRNGVLAVRRSDDGRGITPISKHLRNRQRMALKTLAKFPPKIFATSASPYPLSSSPAVTAGSMP